MVIFFLQVEGVLHTLAALQSAPGLEEVLENDFNFSFCTDSSRLPRLPASKHLGLAELLRKFFRFFADFNFNAASVCLRQGAPAERPVGKVSCLGLGVIGLTLRAILNQVPDRTFLECFFMKDIIYI